MDTRPKYPRTPHLPFSPEQHKDDKVHEDPEMFVRHIVTITEKLDGGNCCIADGQVYARATNYPTCCESFDYIKHEIAWKLRQDNTTFYGENTIFYGENLYAKHSIAYHELTDYFYLFGVLDVTATPVFESWFSVQAIAAHFQVQTVPVIYTGEFASLADLKDFLDDEIKKPSAFGTTREGFVIRHSGVFLADEFSQYVAKYVRKGHVQTNRHWSRNWSPNHLRKPE